MNKPLMHSKDMTADNVSKIAALFPNCVTEHKDSEGNVVLGIDFEKLQQELSSDLISTGEERYQFTWPGKMAAIREANRPTNCALRPDINSSEDFWNTQNLYIEGDNLEVLKLLQENYLGKVKMIYIDPPYNTGSDFVYADNFSENADSYKDKSGMFDENGNMLLQNYDKNVESNGRHHTDWLNMIYPRLKVARNLLTEDGVIFISLDDKESGNLQKVCNEIFGESNFVGNIIWQSRTSISNDDEISTNHNHTFVYSKNRPTLTFGGDDIDANDYVNPDNDPRGPWKLVPLDANHAGGDTIYPVTNPKTGVDYYPPNGRIWCYNREGMQKLMEDGRIKFGMNDDSSPKRKLYLQERLDKGDCKTPSSILLDAGTTKSGTSEIMALFENEKVFDYPKPSTLIQRLLKYGFVKDNDIVVDFFSGSASTAHGLFNYSLETNQNCHFILVQLPENLDESLVKADTDAKKSIKSAIDYLDKIEKPHVLTEIGKERIRRAGKKIKEDSPLTSQHLDTGFRVLKLDSSNMKDVYYTPKDTQNADLFDAVSNIKMDRSPMDLLFQVMLEKDIPLSAKIEQKEMSGKTVFFVEDNYLVATFDENVTEDLVKEIAKSQPYNFVMANTGFATDSLVDNFEQIFKAYSPETACDIL